MAGRQSRRDKQQAAFGNVVWHLYFYGQKDGPGGTSYECRRQRQALYVVKNWNHLDICLARILSGKPGKGCKMRVKEGDQDSKAHGNGLKNFRRRR
jgi:hypothetical protein